MNKKLRVVNSYRLTQIDKYIAERKEETMKIIDYIEKILRSFPDGEFSEEYTEDYLDWKYDRNVLDKLQQEIERLNNIINRARRVLGKYQHFTTPTVEQNKKKRRYNR